MQDNIIPPWSSIAAGQIESFQYRCQPVIKRWLTIVLLFLGLAFIGYLSTVSLLKIEIDADVDDQMQVYWANEKGAFSEAQSSLTRVKKGRHNYWFVVDKFNRSTRFRVDPVTQKTSLDLYQIKLYSLQYAPLGIDLFNDATKSNEIELADGKSRSRAYVQLLTLGDDPYIEFRLVYAKTHWVVLAGLLLIMLVLLRKRDAMPLLCISMGLVFLYALLSLNASTLGFQVRAQQASELTVFWRDVNENFSSTKASKVVISPGQHRYVTKVGSISNAEVVYVEKREGRGDILIDQLVFKEPGFKDFHFSETTETIARVADSKSLLTSVAAFFCAYMCILAGVWYYLKNQRCFYAELFPKLFRMAFLLAALLVVNLAWQADFNIHPDEDAHIASVEYYSQYWDPPTVGDPRALDSYQQPWAISRLNDLGISYFVAGKFRALVQFLFADESFIARAFNAFLFLMFFVMSRDKRCLLFLAPLLCSPQIWYLYAYANRGSFVLFVSILLAWQLANQKSALNVFLAADKCLDKGRYVLFPGLLLGILSIEQTNYLLFILFVFSVLLWRLLFFVKGKKVFFYKCLIFLLIAVSVFSLRYALDVFINGSDKLAQKIAYAEQHATPEFKPSVASTANSYPGLRLRDKGVPIMGIFQPEWDWHKMTFKSFTGFYGYYAEYSPKWYYAYVVLIYGMVLLALLWNSCFEANWRYTLFTVLTLTALSGGILMGILFSWLYDFQPQGRYIFPIIPIILVYLWTMFPRWSRPEKTVVLGSAIALMVLSFYSFNEVALNYLFA